jgi:hypothetical protein
MLKKLQFTISGTRNNGHHQKSTSNGSQQSSRLSQKANMYLSKANRTEGSPPPLGLMKRQQTEPSPSNYLLKARPKSQNTNIINLSNKENGANASWVQGQSSNAFSGGNNSALLTIGGAANSSTESSNYANAMRRKTENEAHQSGS